MIILILLSVVCTIGMIVALLSPSLKGKLPFGWKSALGTLAVSVVLIFFSGIVFFADDKHNYEVIYLSGKLDVITTSGPTLVWFGSVTPWQKSITISSEESDETTGTLGKIGIRFSDKVGADVQASVRYRLPDNKVQFKTIVREFRSMDNLVTNVLVRDIANNAKNTANNFQAYDYMSGGRTEFGQLFEDVVRNGAYKTRKVKVPASEEKLVDGDRSTIKQIPESEYTERVLDADGNPVRLVSVASKYGIILKEAIPYNVDIDPKFRKRLEAQKDEAAKRQLAQQKTETAKIEQDRIIAEGESLKAQEKAIQEQEQVRELTIKETTLQKAIIERDLARVEKETAAIQGETTILEATADAKASKMKVAAGLNPERRAYWKFRSDSIISANFAKAKGPNVVSVGANGGKSGDLTSSLIQVEMAREMMRSRK